MRALAARNAAAYVFAADLSAGRGERTLFGASPELLVSRTDRNVVSHPLAGSFPRSNDPAEDQRRAEALQGSAKDRHEHALVVEAIADVLTDYCSELAVPPVPELVPTGTMWHLGTRITGRLADPGITALDLAVALHPTPAVCGVPPDRARAAIAELEGFQRGFYAGAVGWCDAAGDGTWVVAIRCAELSAQGLRLYAGAGIVAGSDPDAELAETEAKFGTMLVVLGGLEDG